MIHLEDVRRDMGGRTLFAGASFRLAAGDRCGVVGPNGAGKTTLLRLFEGVDEPDGGRIERSRGLRTGVLPQEVAILAARTPLSIAMEGAAELAQALEQAQALEAELEAESNSLGEEDLERLAELHAILEEHRGYDLESRARRILAGLGFDAPEMETPLERLSGGWMMRAALARLLLAEPDLLLLDEPTNHLDLPSLEWLEEHLLGLRSALVIVSHDQAFLDRIATSILEVDGGAVTRYPGNYTRYVAERDLRLEQNEKARMQQDRRVAEIERFIERFRAKNTKAKQVQSRVKMLEKMERVETPTSSRRMRNFDFPAPERTGHSVVQLEGVRAGYGDHTVLEGVDLEITRGERVALVGRNGEGKTTLARIVAGDLAPLSGEVRFGHRVSSATFAQHQVAALDLTVSVFESAAELDPTGNAALVRGMLGAFLFVPDDLEKQVGVLSGGEKSRLALARMMLAPAPLLVLDEPTSHLDIPSREALEQALESFPGTVVLVSHDRRLLERLATTVIEVAEGKIDCYSGGFAGYSNERELRRAARAERAAASESGAVAGTPAPIRAIPDESATRSARGRRRDAAERRKALEPLSRAVRQSEAEVARLESELAALDLRLADPDFYSAGADTESFKQRAALAAQLERAMEAWMQAQEALEAAE